MNLTKNEIKIFKKNQKLFSTLTKSYGLNLLEQKIITA